MAGLLIHRAERADPLVKALGAVLAQPSGDAFSPEVVAVPSRGVERWLAQQLSHVLGAGDGDGVCANVVFPSYTRLLDDAAAAADADYAASTESWSAERSVWPLMTVIDRCVPSEPWCRVLATHLANERSRRFAVASKLARHFASYSLARPAMVRAWAVGLDEQGDGTPLPDDLAWQAELWRRLRTELAVPAPAELLDQACVTMHTADLPDRISIFGATRISPSRVQILAAIARHRDVHLWLHHPSPALWAAVASARAPRGVRRAQRPVVRNPLLASLSRDVSELQQLITGSVPVAADLHHPVERSTSTLLGRLQQQLAADDVPTERRPIAPTDRSITVHAAHGPARQVEVVREAVLGLLAADPTLEPRDVLIMCPDVEAFAPLVAASFGMADDPGGHPAARLRVKLADRSLRQTNPLLSLLSQLLELAADRVTATQLLDLAGTAPVRRRFGFDDDDVERLRDWTAATNARWGLDAHHREAYGLASVTQGTWRAAIDRLLLGVAMEEDAQWLAESLPLDDVDSGDIDLAGRFAELVDRVDLAVRAFARPHPVPAWMRLLCDAVLSLGEPLQAWQAAQLRRELGEVAETAGSTEVELELADVAALLRHRLAGRPTRASFRTGTLTVCTLVPMRSVPHRVVCLLGLDDGALPRNAVIDGDDVLAREPRTGERDVRSEDRQLFLDAVCAAQEHLVVAYTGADTRSGAEVPPCVPLGELLDAIDATATAPDGGPARSHVVVHHPLQPFDARNFTAGELGSTQPFSFDPTGLAGARAAARPRIPVAPLVPVPLPAVPDRDTIGLDDLIRFLQHPARGFLRQRLGVSTSSRDDDPDDALPVELDGLQKWAIGDRVLRQCLAGVPTLLCVQLEQLRGELPPGPLGQRTMREVGQNVDALMRACAAERRLEPMTRDVVVRLADGRILAGSVGGVRGGVALSVSYSSLAPKHRLAAWVNHLALVAATDDAELRTVVLGRRRGGARRSVFAGVDAAIARQLLDQLVELRDAGLCAPLPMSIAASEAYADRRFRGGGIVDAIPAAEKAWQSDKFAPENADADNMLAFGGTLSLDELMAAPGSADDFPDEPTSFGVLARRLWTPVLIAEVDEPT